MNRTSPSGYIFHTLSTFVKRTFFAGQAYFEFEIKSGFLGFPGGCVRLHYFPHQHLPPQGPGDAEIYIKLFKLCRPVSHLSLPGE